MGYNDAGGAIMNRALWAAPALPALALLWVALHDIGHGEPDLSNEYAALAVSTLILAASAVNALRPRRREASR
jgi:hypothetical protein